jgi:hypothetical protein
VGGLDSRERCSRGALAGGDLGEGVVAGRWLYPLDITSLDRVKGGNKSRINPVRLVVFRHWVPCPTRTARMRLVEVCTEPWNGFSA